MSTSSLLNAWPFPNGATDAWRLGANFMVHDDGEVWRKYQWLVVMGGIMAFYMAWAIGANDVANAFATSVGSKTLQIWQACIIAAIFEFVGSIALGGQVAKTIAGSITSASFFQEMPEIFAFGMLCGLTSAATVVALATYWEYAVSTTHSIIGAVLGFGLVYGGAEAIVWADRQPDFPYRKGVVTVFLSWVVAPVMAALLAIIIYLLNRHIIMRRKNSTEWAFWSLPILMYITVYINIFFILYKGASKELQWDKQGHKAGWVSALVALGAALLTIPGVFWLKRKHARADAAEAAEAAAAAAEDGRGKASEPAGDAEAPGTQPMSAGSATTASSTSVTAQGPFGAATTAPAVPSPTKDGLPLPSASPSPPGSDGGKVHPWNVLARSYRHLKYALTADVHEHVHLHPTISRIHTEAEAFQPRTERVYQYLQVFSACAVSFAHGANDVANAIGPFAGIWYVYNNRNVASNAETPKWILALGGAGLVVGLATYGYNIIRVLGVGFARMTPCRGFAAELATALTISLASVYGLPVSTTQTIVGAEMGVGICESIKLRGANWRLFVKTFFGWVVAFAVSGLVSAALFSAGVYAPSLHDERQIRMYEVAMTNVMRVQLSDLNQTNLANNRTLGVFDSSLDRVVRNLDTNLTNLNNLKKFGKPSPYDYLALFRNTTLAYVNYTTPNVGFYGAPSNNSQALTIPRA